MNPPLNVSAACLPGCARKYHSRSSFDDLDQRLCVGKAERRIDPAMLPRMAGYQRAQAFIKNFGLRKTFSAARDQD